MSTPPFKIKGFHLDLRVQAMTIPALRALARRLADMGLNTLVMEYEANFPFKQHAVISNPWAYARADLRAFVRYCAKLGLDVVPLQHCFGHVEHILQHERYLALREDNQNVSQVCPLRIDRAVPVFTELFADLAALHPSPYFHIGCDETRLLGHCPQCQAFVREEGVSRLFVQYVNAMCEIVRRLGKTPVLWADIILRYPEAVADLPRDAVYIDWNYGWSTDKFGCPHKFLNHGLTVWGAPALRCSPDNFYTTNWEVHLENLRDFVPYAAQAGYQGLIMTSWSTSGIFDLLNEMPGEIKSLQTVRRVYPLSGFELLLQAYEHTLNNPAAPLDPAAFARAFAQRHFGLSAADARQVWAALKNHAVRVYQGQPSDGQPLARLAQRTAADTRRLRRLTPTGRHRDFQHLLLMQAIRQFYLEVRMALAKMNGPGFTAARRPALKAEVRRLDRQARGLDVEFARLQQGFLKPTELALESAYRRGMLNFLKERLGL